MMFMPLIFLIFCYNFAAALALYYTTQNLFTILQLWHNQKQPVPVLEKVAAGREEVAQRTIMTPKELLDTILGYLGFVVQIDETQSEGGNPTLQIYMEESHTLDRPRWRDARSNPVPAQPPDPGERQRRAESDRRLRALPLDARGPDRPAGAGTGRAGPHFAGAPCSSSR